MENIKICVIGSGRWGLNHINTLNTLKCLGGIVDIDEARLNTLSQKYSNIQFYTSVEDAINSNFDGYVVATTAETHFKIAKDLLEHGKNVLVEKPMALSEIEANELVNLSKKNNCNLLVGHQLLFHPAIIKIKELVSSGTIGELLYISSSRKNLGTVRKKENVIWSFAPHDISIINYLTQMNPKSINSFASSFLQEGIFDRADIEFSYDSNLKAYIHVSWLNPTKEQKLVVVGDRGMITFDDASSSKEIILDKKWINKTGDMPVIVNDGVEIIEYQPSMPLENELKYFINLIQNSLNLENGLMGYSVVNILEKISN